MAIRVLAVVIVLTLCGCPDRPRPGPEGAPFGAPCADNGDCASGACLIIAEPFCTHECVDDCVCPAGTVCARASDALSVCAPGENSCVTAEDGGTPPMDGALPPADSGPVTSGGGAGAPCTTSADCAAVRSAGGTGPSPEYMTVPQACWTQARTGFPGGLCSMADCAMNYYRDPCPTGTACINLTSGSVCATICAGPSECRSGWICRDDIDGPGVTHEAVCWVPCTRTPCAAGLTCRPDGTCGGPVVPPGPLDGCTDWTSAWSCTDRSPTLCSCSCPAWPHSGTAPSIECELIAVGQVACTCGTGGDAREYATVDFMTGGTDCGQARTVFDSGFCGLVP